MLAEAPVVVVPVVAAVLEVAEGQAAVPVEIDKAQSRFGSKIECIRKKGGPLRPDERFRKTAEIRRHSAQRAPKSFMSKATSGTFHSFVSFFPENPKEL